MVVRRIIFVCTENTCRSAMAEALFLSMQKGAEIEVLSRGTVVLFPEPINPKVEVVFRNHELNIAEHIAKQFKAAECTDFTLVLTMNESQKMKLAEEYGIHQNVYTLKEYTGESGDVYDPYGKSLIEYEECFGELIRLVKKTIYRIEKDINEDRTKIDEN